MVAATFALHVDVVAIAAGQRLDDARVLIEPLANEAGDFPVVDPSTGVLYVRTIYPLGKTGAAVLTLPKPTAMAPANYQYRATVQYRPLGSHYFTELRRVIFSVPADAATLYLGKLVDTDFVPPVYVPALLTARDQAVAAASAADDSADAAAASAGAANASAVQAQVTADAVPATTNAAMTVVDADAASSFRVQQDARLLASYAAVITVTGTQNISTILQSTFDAGVTKIRLQGGGTAILNASVYLDDTSSRRQYIIEGDGKTTLQLGTASGLASTTAYTPNPTYGWAFHLNTNRSAVSGGVVTVSDATRSTGAGFPTRPRLTFKNLILDGNNQLAGYVFGNTAVAKAEDCTFRLVVRWLSWRGYADGASLMGGQMLTPAPNGWLIDQITNGDLVNVDNFKGDEGGVWRAANCHSGKVSNCIAGSFAFTNCRGISVEAHYTEADRTWPDNIPMFDIDRTQITFDGLSGNAAHAGNRYMVRIIDSTANSEAHSDVEIRHIAVVTYFNATVDVPRVPDIYIESMNGSSRLRVESPSGLTNNTGSTLYDRDGVLVASADASIQTALTNAGAALGATSWLLRKRAAWEIVTPGLMAGTRMARALSTPSINSVSSQVSPASTLTDGTTEYAIALIDADGNYTLPSAAVSVTTVAGQTDLVLAQFATIPATVVLWKKAGAGVLAAPDAYVKIPVDGQIVRLYNTGAYVNGRAWVTASVPVPNTVAGSNGTYDRLVLPSGLIIAQGPGSPEGKYAAPIGSLYSRTDGTAYTSLYRKTVGGNNGWRSQRDTPGTILANVSYRPGSATQTDTVSTTFVDVDATNLVISFVAPADGRVMVRLTADCSAVTTSSDFYWNLRDSGGDVTNTDMHMGFSTSPFRLTYEVVLSGLTSGTTYSWKWGQRASNAANAARIRYGSTHGPATMTVLTAS